MATPAEQLPPGWAAEWSVYRPYRLESRSIDPRDATHNRYLFIGQPYIYVSSFVD